MKLTAPILGILALGVALWILWRRRDAPPRFLAGRMSPRFLRLVALFLLALGAGRPARGSPQDPPPPPGPAGRSPEPPGPSRQDPGDLVPYPTQPPAGFSRALVAAPRLGAEIGLFGEIGRWLDDRGSGDFRAPPPDTATVESLESLIARIPASLKLGLALRADRDARLGGQRWDRMPDDEALRLLDEAESLGLFDSWLVTWLWRKTLKAEPSFPVSAHAALLARLEDHARLADTLVRLRWRLSPRSPGPWMSKAGRPRRQPIPPLEPGGVSKLAAWIGDPSGTPDPAMLAEGTAAYARCDAGPWHHEATLRLTVAAGSPPVRLHRRGLMTVLTPGTTFRLRRLDLVHAAEASTLLLEDQGALLLPPDATLGPGNAATFLDALGRRSLEQSLERFFRDPSQTSSGLSRRLPIAAPSLRDALRTHPEAAARIDTLLVHFDE